MKDCDYNCIYEKSLPDRKYKECDVKQYLCEKYGFTFDEFHRTKCRKCEFNPMKEDKK